MNNVFESSLSCVWQSFEDPERQAALLTAFRSEFDYETNVSRNKQLTADIRQLGYGFVFVDGYWVENAGTKDEQRVKEDSILVTAKKADRNFSKNIHNLGNRYNQEAVLVKDNNGANIVFADSSIQQLGSIQPGKLGTMYTKLRNNKKANTFVFESERNDLGFIERLAHLAGIK